MTAPPVMERYVTGRELAELMGVSVRTVKRLTAAGMPSETWGMRARRYRPSEAIAWARARAPHDKIGVDDDHWPARRANALGPDTRR